MAVVIETTLGDITVDLFTDERPIACLNFIKLCKLKYYNYNLFHTVEQGFIAQTGDPTGVGDGGCSIWGVVEGTQKRFFEAETLPKIHHSTAGLLSLVSAGKSLAGSQFFFTLGDSLTSLDGIHCVIGEVVEGHETLRKLNDAIVDEKFRPFQDIRITHTVIIDDPFPNPRGLKVPSRSPSPTPERLQNGRIAADEDIDDTDGKTMEELQEMLAEREAKARATILEIVGDLPDAEMAPPENVLFVCKLNPVTTDDDLEIIFSRFGVVKSCEVIRDRKSGDSLQYAFVEFEDQKSCEAAYFKMDNVLIDDRRIHVDFSQSVAKVQWRGKGRGVVGQEGRLDFNNIREGNASQRRGRERVDHRRDARHDERPSGESADRRKAREERHREQRDREAAREERHRDQRRRITDVQRHRSRSRDGMSERGRDNRHSYNQQRDKSSRTNDRYINERYRDDGDRRDRARNRGSTPERRRLSPPRRHSPERNTLERNNRNRDRLHNRQTEQEDKNLKRKQNAKAQKNSKRAKSSSSSASEDSSESETESSSTSTDTSSSSDSDSSHSNDRKKRKKNKKIKHKKSHRPNKHKKSKKKHRK